MRVWVMLIVVQMQMMRLFKAVIKIYKGGI